MLDAKTSVKMTAADNKITDASTTSTIMTDEKKLATK